MKAFFSVIREIKKGKGDTVTKILSLTIGMVVGIVVLAYNLSVYSYDRFYEGADEIYRIQEWEIVNGQWEDYNWIIRAPLAPAMADHIPEIESATVVFGQESLEYQKGEDYIQAWTIYADTSFFNVFPRPLYAGNPAEDLVLPGQVFVSAKFAQKMFGDRQAVGQELVTEEGSWIVTGIFETVPENTHLYFDVVRSLETLRESSSMDWNGEESFRGYLRLKKGVKPATVEVKMGTVVKEYEKNEYAGETYSLQPVKKIELENRSEEIALLYALAFVVLLISILNYILLSFSSWSVKAREISIRKVNGATMNDIFALFLTEAVVFIGIALAFTVGIIWSVKPYLKEIMFVSSLHSLCTVPLFLALLCLIGGFIFFAGFIPAKIFSSISVLQAFRPLICNRYWWKRGLLWVQFTVTGFITILLLIFVGQYDTLVHTEQGYSLEGLYYARFKNEGGLVKAQSLKGELERLPFVMRVSVATDIPLHFLNGTCAYHAENERELVCFRYCAVDEDFLKVLQVPSTDRQAEPNVVQKRREVVVNERFVQLLKKQDYDKNFFLMGGEIKQIGEVCTDFQIGSFYNEQQPLLLCPLVDSIAEKYLYLLLRISSPVHEEVRIVESTIQRLLEQPRVTLCRFQDTFYRMYQEVRMMRNRVALVFSLALSLVILGLMGFVGDELNSRMKEIAIRKVNGASMNRIFLLLFHHLGSLFLLSLPFVIASAYYAGSLWLRQFAVQISLTWKIFVSGLLITIFVICMTLLLKSWRGIRINPAETLKMNRE